MVAVAAKSFESGVGRNFNPAPITILAGDNNQLKADVFRSIRSMSGIASDDPFRFVDLGSDALEKDPGLLADELGAISMFGGTRLIRAVVSTRQCERVLEQARTAPRGDWLLVIETGDISESNWIGSVKNARDEMIVFCAAENAGDFRSFVRGECGRANLRFDEQAVESLILLAGDDRAGVRAEIEKLSLLHRDAHSISVTDVQEVVADASSMLADEVAAAALSGDTARSATAIDRLCLSGSDPTQALGAALRHVLAIHRNQSRQWSRTEITAAAINAADARALTRSLASAVLNTRADGPMAALIAERALVGLSNAVRKRGRS